MSEYRKQSFAADSLMNTKESDSNFVPMNYDYSKNYDGKPHGTQTPDMYDAKVRKSRRKEYLKYNDID